MECSENEIAVTNKINSTLSVTPRPPPIPMSQFNIRTIV